MILWPALDLVLNWKFSFLALTWCENPFNIFVKIYKCWLFLIKFLTKKAKLVSNRWRDTFVKIFWWHEILADFCLNICFQESFCNKVSRIYMLSRQILRNMFKKDMSKCKRQLEKLAVIAQNWIIFSKTKRDRWFSKNCHKRKMFWCFLGKF